MYWHKTPWWLQWLYPGLEWHGSRRHNVIHLTFDDGPIPQETPFILDTLKKYDVKGTFFCVGENILKNEGLFRSVLEAGHAVGNHTMHHVKGWGMNADDYVQDVAACRKIMAENGRDSQLFRPPYGKATRKQLAALKDYRIIMWDVLSGDFDRRLSPEQCLEESLKASRKGSIVLFHDNIKAHDRLHYALPRFIEEMLQRGFAFETL